MKIIGHRGARGLAPENTIASLQKALEYHVDELEFDLRVTADGIAVLHHDPYLKDAAGNRHTLHNCTYAELLAHKPDLVTFEKMLAIIGHTVPLYIEVKPREPVQPIITIMKAYLAKGWPLDCFMLGSFSQKTLLQLHAELPEIQKIVLEHWSGIRATHRARQVNTKRLSMNQRWLWSGFIRAMQRGGYDLTAYVLNNPTKADRWAKHGLYGVVTDRPDRFKN